MNQELNESDNRKDSTFTRLLTDLPVSPEQAEETKAGTPGGGGGTGKVHVHDISIMKHVDH